MYMYVDGGHDGTINYVWISSKISQGLRKFLTGVGQLQGFPSFDRRILSHEGHFVKFPMHEKISEGMHTNLWSCEKGFSYVNQFII